jgi:hypothetical protein
VLVRVAHVRSGSPVKAAAVVLARVVRVARARSGSRVKVALVKVAQVVARVVNGSRVKVALVRVAQVVARVVNGSRVKVALAKVVRVKSGSRVRVVRVVEIVVEIVAEIVAVRAKNGSRVKVAVVRAVQVVALVVSGSRVRVLVVMTVVQVVVRVVMTVVMTVAKTCRKPKRSAVALKCSLVKARVSTARTSHLVTVQIDKRRSLTKAQCVAVSSTPIVARRASRHVVALVPSRGQSDVMMARCFPLRQPCKSHWPAKFGVRSAIVATTR